MDLNGHCDTCGAPCDGQGCTIDRRHLAAIDPTARDTYPNRVGEPPHAYPESTSTAYSTCTICGAEIFWDDTDDLGVSIWTHTETLDHFCEAAE